MASTTTRLGLLKKDTVADGNDTFNIKTMLNENWDKIDKRAALLDPVTGKLPADQVEVDTTSLEEQLTELETQLGNLPDLETAEKANLVAAINEIRFTIAAHLADGTHLTQAQKDLITGALQKSGGRMTGLLELASRLRLAEFDGINNFVFKYSQDDSDQILRIRRDGANNYAAWILNGGSVRELLHAGNLASLGVSQAASGSYAGNATNNRFINIGFTPKFLIIGGYITGENGFRHAAVSFRFERGMEIPLVGSGGSNYEVSGNKNGITTNGIYVSNNGGYNYNANGYTYNWTAIG